MKIDQKVIENIELNLDTKDPEKGDIKIKILGFGEISLVFSIVDDPAGDVAYKRLPIFSSEKQVKSHIDAYVEYNRMLNEEIGLNIPPYEAIWVYRKNNKDISLYCAQKTVDPQSVGNRLLHLISDAEIEKLVLLLMREMKKVWQFNRDNPEIQIALDGQISNFAIKIFDMENLVITEETELIYLDTSTPMYRIHGKDAMDGKLFLKSVPPGLRGIVKFFFLKEVLDRYYDWREVTIDLIANFYKEQKEDIIPQLIKVVNKFFMEEAADFDIKPLEMKEINKYYKSDKFIWVLFQNLRLMHRFIKTKIFKKEYEFYLPQKIKR